MPLSESSSRQASLAATIGGMRAIDFELNMLRVRHAQGADISEALISWAKRAYAMDHIDVDEMERLVAVALSGKQIAWLEPGERVVPMGQKNAETDASLYTE